MRSNVGSWVSPVTRAGLWGVGLLLILSLFMGIQDLPLRDFREVRFAELGWEMIETGDWIVPHINGSPYLNKPPMVGWLVAFSMKVLGKNELAARLPNALATLGTALFVGWLVYMMVGPPWAILGATLYLGSPGAQYYGRMLSSDVVGIFFMSGALASFCKGLMDGRRAYHLLGFALCAMAVLSRGLAGALYPLGALLVFLVVLERRKFQEVPWLMGLMIFLGISLPWFLVVEYKQPGFLSHHFLEQQLQRVASGGGSPFVALPHWEIFLGFLGFLGPLALLLPWAGSTMRSKGNIRGFLWIYVLLVLGSVALSAGRNQPYTLPALAPLVALVGAWLAQPGRVANTWGASLLLAGLGVACGAGVFVTGEILERIWKDLARPELLSRVQICMAMVALSMGISAYFMAKGKRWASATLVGAVMLPGGWMLSLVQGAMASVESRRDLAVWVCENVPEQWPLVLADPMDRQFEGTAGWSFYSGRRVLMVRFQEKTQIRAQAPRLPRWMISREEFLEMMSAGKPLALAATPKGIELLNISGLPPPVAADGKFQLWKLAPKEQEKEPSATLRHTGRTSSSITCLQEG